jgi:hypothetical protein
VTSKQPPFNSPGILPRALLLLALIQVGMFFIGLQVPLNRLVMLWGKSFKDRQAIAWPAGRALTQVAEQLPMDAKIYVEDPQKTVSIWVFWHAIHYFYPRYLSASMTDHYYGSDQAAAAWNEYPDEAWLVSHKFTHVMSFKDGIHLRPVARSLQPPNATP